MRLKTWENWPPRLITISSIHLGEAKFTASGYRMETATRFSELTLTSAVQSSYSQMDSWPTLGEEDCRPQARMGGTHGSILNLPSKPLKKTMASLPREISGSIRRWL